MLIRFVLFLLGVFLSQSAYAAGPACFSYETYEHQGPAAGANNALLNYNHATIFLQNGAIPPLAAGALQLQVSLRDTAGGGVWDDTLIPLGAGLTYAQACMMTLERQGLGIRVNFRHPAGVATIALGGTMAAAAAAAAATGFMGGAAAFQQYLDRALGGGGYRPTVLAAALYRFRNNIPIPNFIALPVGIADTVLIHIHDPIRVSKNVKELSYNSVLGNVGYVSIKDTIDGTYAAAGLPLPHSATVVSSDNLQLN